MEQLIKDIINKTIFLNHKLIDDYINIICDCADLIVATINNNKKILICGNGGSAADSQHFASELIVRFKSERKSIPAIALTADSSVLTACANDYSFDKIFSRQIEGLGHPEDLLIGITTSGNSSNIIEAFNAAQNLKMNSICLSGNDGGQTITNNINHTIIVPSSETARIQEIHKLIIHIWCEIIDSKINY